MHGNRDNEMFSPMIYLLWDKYAYLSARGLRVSR